MIFENIQGLCEKRGMTIWALEKELGFGASTIRNWKRVCPRVDKLKAVADYFGVTVDFLIGGEEIRCASSERCDGPETGEEAYREWHEACTRRGVTPQQMLKWLREMGHEKYADDMEKIIAKYEARFQEQD